MHVITKIDTETKWPYQSFSKATKLSSLETNHYLKFVLLLSLKSDFSF